MTEVFSKARYELMRAIALGDPDISVTAPPLIDKLVAERIVAYDGTQPVLTPEGNVVYARQAREQALGQLRGVTVRHARRDRRCVCADQATSWIVTVRRPGGVTVCEVEGDGGADYADQLTRDNPDATVTSSPVENPSYSPDCLQVIAAGTAFVEHHGRAAAGCTTRYLCIRCAFRLLGPRLNRLTAKKETDHARSR